MTGHWLRTARWLWFVLLTALLLRVLATNRSAITDLVSVESPLLLAVALCAAAAQLWINAAFWRRSLAATGHVVDLRAILTATARSVPARYVPGSVWYAASRVALLRTRGVGVGALTVTAILEAVLTVLVSLTLGGALLAVSGRLPERELLGVAWVVVPAVAIAPPVLNRLLSWLARRRGVTAPTLSWSDQAALVGWMVTFWALSAAAFTCYLMAFDAVPVALPTVAGAFLVAWAVGFLTPIAPQGAGAFEVAFVTLLAGAAAVAGPLGPLALLVAGHRALIGVRDAVAFAWGTWSVSARATQALRRPPGSAHR